MYRMREAHEMITLAKALHMRIMMGCMTETSVAISAAAQFADQLEWADLDGNWLIAKRYIYRNESGERTYYTGRQTRIGLNLYNLF